MAHQLTILCLDEIVAKALGQKTLATSIVLLSIVLILSAAAVALVGSLAFVGLIIPHFIKMFVIKIIVLFFHLRHLLARLSWFG